MSTSIVTGRRQARKSHLSTPPKDLLERPESAGFGTHKVVMPMVVDETCCRKMLDIPCGYGSILEQSARLGIEAHGADVRPTIRQENIPFRLADMNEPLPYASEEFDLITCIDGIEHIERQFDFVRECRRILRPEGALILSTPNVSSLRSRFRWLLTGFHNKAKTPLDETAPHASHHRGMIAFHELRYLLHSCGFRITEIRANRLKPAAWVYAPLAPLAYLATRLVFAQEARSDAERQINREILPQMFSPAVLFGETLIIKARRVG